MDYVARWRAGVSRLQSVLVSESSVYQFVNLKGLSPSMAFMTLRSRLPQLKNMKDDDIGAFISITDEVLDLTAIFPVTGGIDG